MQHFSSRFAHTVSGSSMTRLSPYQSPPGNPFQSYLSNTRMVNSKAHFVSAFSPKSGYPNSAKSPKTNSSTFMSDSSPNAHHISALDPISTATTTISQYTSSCLTPPAPSSPVAIHVTSPFTPTTTPVSSSQTSPVFNFSQHPTSDSSSPVRGTPPLTPSKLSYSSLCINAAKLASGSIDSNFLSVPRVVKDILISRPSRGRGRGRGRVPSGAAEANLSYSRTGLHSESPLIGDIPIQPGIDSWQDKSGIVTKNKDTFSTTN